MDKVKLIVNREYYNSFIIYLYKNDIDILKISNDINTVDIIIKYVDFKKIKDDLEKIENIKLRYLGIRKISIIILKNIHVTFMIFLSIILLYFLSNIIFDVEIVTTDNKMKEKLYNSLEKYDIKKYSFKKSYEQIQNVKSEILKEYKSSVEWIEIYKKGTKYIVKYEPKVLKSKKKDYKKNDIVSKKNAIIKDIYISSGQIVKEKNMYVKKGEVIVSSDIKYNDEIKNTVGALGDVYGEVWYLYKIKYPYNYYSYKTTGKVKKNLYFKFNNRYLELFKFHQFNDKIDNRIELLSNNLLPISFGINKQKEINVLTGLSIDYEIEDYAIKYAIKKINDSLKDKEHILNYKVIKIKYIDSGVYLTVFFSIYEQIGIYKEHIEGR